ncbi:MAG: hypothetical protein IT183_08815 [Acidobacteria bacterium]|nr:hypothetical protein [Acidobacteriota bacterium]
MRVLRIVLCAVAALLTPLYGAAQSLASFDDIGLRINLDDRIRIEDRTGTRTTGRLTRLTRDDIAIETDAGERRFPREDVREVARREPAYRRGAVIGAAVFAVLGAVATCAHEKGDNCIALGSVRAAPIGVGAGLAMSALIPRMRTVYRAPETTLSVPPSRPETVSSPGRLDDLALHVDLDDHLRVEDQAGVRTTGRLVRLTSDAITIRTATGERHFTRESVREVAVRRRPLRTAVLVGAGLGASAAAVAACKGPDREECIDAPIIGGAVGGGLGFAIGALIRRTTVVYPEPDRQTLVLPLVSRGALGVRAQVTW